MSNYKFSLYDYHAIQEANIEINGITVLTGINGCGKSTISRWIYYLVLAINNFEYYELKEYYWSIMNIYNGCMRSLPLSPQDNRKVGSLIQKMRQPEYITSENISEIRVLYEEMADIFSVCLSEYVGKVGETRYKRVLNYIKELLLDGGELEATTNSSFYYQLFINAEQIIFNSYQDHVANRSLGRCMEFIANYLGEEDGFPDRMQLSEDNVKLIQRDKDYVDTLLNLTDAIYVDTPMAIMGGLVSRENTHWSRLKQLMYSEEMKSSDEAKKLAIRIKRVMGGDVLRTKDETRGGTELRYRRDDGLDIDVIKVATGMKSMTYLLQLLKSGKLNKNSLLIIDEPEAHEHPQWIFELARFLVLLYKQVGVKLLLASHNPDMISALQAIARKENVIDSLIFYHAKESEVNNRRFIFEKQGSDIAQIFKSFNIAIDRIQLYGAE